MKRFAIALSVVALLAAAAVAGDGARRGPRVIEGAEVERRVEEVTSKIDWQRSLEGALAKAKAEQKAVLWLHVLGDLDGAT